MKNKNKTKAIMARKKWNNFRVYFVATLTIAITVATCFFNFQTFLYQTNILAFPEHLPFSGTVAPIKKVPDFVHLSSSKWDLDYNSLSSADLIDLPEYNPDLLAVSTDNLKWGNTADDQIRNAKITYSVPYLGTYQLDGKENAGSHPAIDIKIPEGTPVYAIANGTVIKSSNQTSGFGHHIVIMHKNFPTIENPNDKTIIYSSYNHLSDIFVETGDIVNKGDQIALSGSTGTATTPHLHFQIDNNDAPWHPFWPFTWKEAQDAGYDFFSAVNNSLGKENAVKTTINPMKYAAKYLDNSLSGNVASSSPQAVSYVANLESEIEIAADETTGEVDEVDEVDEPEITDEAEVAENVETTLETAPEIVLEIAPEPQIEENIAAPGITLENTSEIAPILEFSDIPADYKYYDAVLYLANKKIVKGYEDRTFKPLKKVNRVEALKFILNSIDVELENGDLPFSDTNAAEWYSKYLFTGLQRNIVNGYPDKTFRPGDTVNKAEFFKILFNGMGVDINPVVAEMPYEDVPVDAWFAPYIAYAKEIGIIDSNITRINPSNPMRRAEVADAMYKLVQILE